MILENWQWFFLGFYIIEKIVRMTPSKKDDILFDMILKPIAKSFQKEQKSRLP